MDIDSILHKELQVLHDECEKFIKELKTTYAPKLRTMLYYKAETEEKTDILLLLEKINSQLKLHLNLDDKTLYDIDFYTPFKTQFSLSRYNKKVEFYIQEGFGTNPQLVTDEDTLKNEFTIKNCMKSMEIVPFNLASNAMKYMPSNQTATIVLIKTSRRNIIKITNLGPKNREKNLDKLKEEGYRGDNSSKMAGMGLGLAMIESIVGLHENILDASIDIEQDNKNVIKLGDEEYVPFSVTITYLSTQPNKVIIDSLEEFVKRIPLMIAHNMVDILANLFAVVDRLPRLHFKVFDKEVKTRYDSLINKFRLNIEKMQKTIKMNLYIRNSYSAEEILGNVCPIAIQSFFKSEITNMHSFCYNYKPKPKIKYGAGFYDKNSDVFSAVYPAIYSLCELILKKADNDSALEILIDNDGIVINSDVEFSDVIYDSELDGNYRLESEDKIQSCMCIDILNSCNIFLIIDNNSLTIDLTNINDD